MTQPCPASDTSHGREGRAGSNESQWLRRSVTDGPVHSRHVWCQTPDRSRNDRDSSAPKENPLLEGLGPRRTPEPCVLVIFGASGDLTRRKIFPALYALAYRRLLPERFAVVGTARSGWTDDEFRDRMEHAVREFGRDDFKQEVWDWLAEATHYLPMDFADESKADQLSRA